MFVGSEAGIIGVMGHSTPVHAGKLNVSRSARPQSLVEIRGNTKCMGPYASVWKSCAELEPFEREVHRMR